MSTVKKTAGNSITNSQLLTLPQICVPGIEKLVIPRGEINTYSKSNAVHVRKNTIGSTCWADQSSLHGPQFMNVLPDWVDPIHHTSNSGNDDKINKLENSLETEDLTEIDSVINETVDEMPMLRKSKRTWVDIAKAGQKNTKDQQMARKSVKKKCLECTKTSGTTDVFKAEPFNPLKGGYSDGGTSTVKENVVSNPTATSKRQNATRNDDFAIEELVLQSIADRGKSKQLFGEGNKQKLKTKKGTKLKVSQKLKVKPEKLFVIEHYLHDMFKPEVSPFASHKSLKDEKKFNLETLFDSSAETIPKKTYSKATPNKARKKSVGFGRLFRSDPLPAHISKFVNRSPERVDPIRHISTVFRDEMVIEPANLVQTEDIREIGIVDETDIGVPMFYSPKRVCGNATKNDVGKGKNKDQQDGKSVKKKISESTITSFTDVLKAETLNSLKPNKYNMCADIEMDNCTDQTLEKSPMCLELYLDEATSRLHNVVMWAQQEREAYLSTFRQSLLSTTFGTVEDSGIQSQSAYEKLEYVKQCYLENLSLSNTKEKLEIVSIFKKMGNPFDENI